MNPPQPRGADLFESYVGSIIASCSLAMMPMDELEARKLVEDVTPHAFRAGLAGDLVSAEVS